MPQQSLDARIPAGELAAQGVGISWRRPGFLHFFVRRHEADIVDDRSRSYRKGEEVPPRAEPHLPAIHRPMRDAFVRDDNPIGVRYVELLTSRTKYMRLKL